MLAPMGAGCGNVLSGGWDLKDSIRDRQKAGEEGTAVGMVENEDLAWTESR